MLFFSLSTVSLTLNSLPFAFCGAQLNKTWNAPTAHCQRSPPSSLNHSVTITIHHGGDVRGPIAGLFNRSASKLLFNVSYNSPKQSGLLSISRARPFKWVWYMTHEGLQVSVLLWEERRDGPAGGGARIKCLGLGIIVLNWETLCECWGTSSTDENSIKLMFLTCAHFSQVN